MKDEAQNHTDSSFRIKIVDFGLARADDDINLTKTGTVMGTPRYMSPEQAQGQTVDYRSDLFSLGAVLYHLTTGEGPFDRGNLTATLLAVMNDDPDRIESHRDGVPKKLADLIRQLLEKDPEARPQSADEVVTAIADIEHHSIEEPRAKKRSRPQPMKPNNGNRRRLLIGSAIVAPLLIILGIILLIRTPEGTLRVEVDDANLEVLVDGDAIEINDKAWEGKRKARKHELALKLNGTLSRDGTRVAYRMTHQLPMQMIDVSTKREVSLPKEVQFALAMDYNADGTLFATGHPDGTVRVWNSQTLSQVGQPFVSKSGEQVRWVSLSGDGTRLLALTNEDPPMLYAWHVNSRESIVVPFAPNVEVMISLTTKEVRTVASSDGRTLAVAYSTSPNHFVRLWDVDKGQVIATHFVPSDGSRLMTAGVNTPVCIWSLSPNQSASRVTKTRAFKTNTFRSWRSCPNLRISTFMHAP